MNEINKYTFTYDSSALRCFVNDELDVIAGTSNGFSMSNVQPFKFFQTVVVGYEQYMRSTIGLLDNINIHNGIATKVRNANPNEQYLVVDLAFDGANGSTNIVDNGVLKSNWTLNGNAKISTDQKFDGFSSMLVNGDTSFIKTYLDLGPSFTIEFEFITPSKDSGYHLCLLDYGDGSLGYSGFVS